MVDFIEVGLILALILGSLNAILNTIVIRNFPVVREIRLLLREIGGVFGVQSTSQTIQPSKVPTTAPPSSLANLLATQQNTISDPVREVQEQNIKYLKKENVSMRNRMNRLFKEKQIQDLEDGVDENVETESGETVTSENLDIEILKKFGAKIPALNGINLNDPVAKQTVAAMINENGEYKKYYNAAKILKNIIPQQAEQDTAQKQIEGFA